MLNFTNKVASNIKKNGYLFQLCGKVDYNDGENTKTCYVLHETRTHLQMITVRNRIINIQKPKYSEQDVTYIGTNNEEINSYNFEGSREIFNTIGSDGLLPSYYLGANTNESTGIVRVSPIRIIVYINSSLNVRIYSDYVVRNPDYSINETLSSCKYMFYYN